MTLRRARCGAVLLTLLMISVTGLSGCGGARQGKRAAPTSPATTPVAAKTPVVMFLGDSYTAGNADATRDATYAADTARLLGWQVIVGGEPGTGFVAPGRVRQPFHVLFDHQLAWRPAPDLLIVAGGHNDRRYRLSKITDAARSLLATASARWPGTALVLIGPMWGSGHPPTSVLAIRDAMHGIADEARVPFIDPVGERWITGSQSDGTGNAARYIRTDQTHPTPSGHRYFAQKLAEHLKRLGLTRPARRS